MTGELCIRLQARSVELALERRCSHWHIPPQKPISGHHRCNRLVCVCARQRERGSGSGRRTAPRAICGNRGIEGFGFEWGLAVGTQGPAGQCSHRNTIEQPSERERPTQSRRQHSSSSAGQRALVMTVRSSAPPSPPRTFVRLGVGCEGARTWTWKSGWIGLGAQFSRLKLSGSGVFTVIYAFSRIYVYCVTCSTSVHPQESWGGGYARSGI